MPFLGHLPELLIIAVVALLVFGPKRLPDMASSVGTAIKEFRKTMSEVTSPPAAAQPPAIPPAAAPIVEAEAHE